MPPRPLPRLTLYTGGKECSLCEIFKVELDKLRKVQPFDLDYWNIRDPPPGTDEREGKKWRRLYQYDIVSSRNRDNKNVHTVLRIKRNGMVADSSLYCI